MKKWLVVLLLGLMLVFAAACGNEEVQSEGENTGETTEQNSDAEAEKGTLRWATNANWAAFCETVLPDLEALGYDVELIVLDDTASVNVSTYEGSTDFNLFQHKPYMDNYNAANNADLVMVEPYILTCRMGLASMVKSLEDVDAALFQAGYLVSAGLGLDNVLAWSKDDDRFPIGVVVRAEDVDEPWVADVISALTSERSAEVADELWEGARVPLF